MKIYRSMEMNREKLLQAIEKVKPAIALENMTEQNNLISFDTKEVKSYNDEILITAPIKTKINGAVPADELIALFRKMKDKKIEINQKEKVLEIIGKSTKARLKMSDAKFPEVGSPKKWKKLPKNFIEGLKYCRFSVAGQGSVLNNVFVTKDKIISCDNYRVTEFTMKNKFKKDYLIPSSTVNVLIPSLPIFFSSDKSWLFFKNEGEVVICVRKVLEKYPDIESILASKVKGTKIKLPDELKDGLQRTKILSDEDIVTGNRMINVVIAKNRIICHGECSLGQIDETIDIDFKGKEIAFAIVPDFLCEILDKTQTMIVGDSSLKFKTKNLTHIIQLIK